MVIAINTTFQHCDTVRKIQNLSSTHILREINFEDSKSARTALFAILGAMNFVHSVEFQPSKSAKIHKYQNSEPLNVLKWQILLF